MKARRKNSNENWKEIKYVQLEDSDILFKKEYLEFDTLSTELKANEQINNENIGKMFMNVLLLLLCKDY